MHHIPEDVIFWHRVSASDYATKLFDHFLHVKRHDNVWYVHYKDEELIHTISMETAFDYAEQFYLNEMQRRTDEPCL